MLRKLHNINCRIQKIGIENCYTSEVTVAELLYGAECCSNVELNVKLVKDFCGDLKIRGISQYLGIFAKEKARLRKMGRIIDDFDLLIGCTAIQNDCILVTDNIKNMERLPVKIENWIIS